jgi:uncharacterized protein (DUF3820 family)
MPFGKHKGKPVEQVPKGYLRWLKTNVELRGPLAEAVDCVLAGKPIPKPVSIEELVEQIVKPFDLEQLRQLNETTRTP